MLLSYDSFLSFQQATNDIALSSGFLKYKLNPAERRIPAYTL